MKKKLIRILAMLMVAASLLNTAALAATPDNDGEEQEQNNEGQEEILDKESEIQAAADEGSEDEKPGTEESESKESEEASEEEASEDEESQDEESQEEESEEEESEEEESEEEESEEEESEEEESEEEESEEEESEEEESEEEESEEEESEDEETTEERKSATDPVDNFCQLEDGVYTVGENYTVVVSGKRDISVPEITVSDGKAVATVRVSGGASLLDAAGRLFTAEQGDGAVFKAVPVSVNGDNHVIVFTEDPEDEGTACTFTVSFAGTDSNTENTEKEDGASGDEKKVVDEESYVEEIEETVGTAAVASVQISLTRSLDTMMVLRGVEDTGNEDTGKADSESTYDDGSYEAEVGSDFAMFPIGSASAEVTDGQIYVTIHVTKATYDRLYLGSKDDENKTPVYTGTAEDGGMAYTFPVSEEDLGKTIPFVPGKSSDDSWYTKAQKYLTLPAALTKEQSGEEPGNTGSTYDDGSYEAEVGSDFAMFPIGSASAEVTDGQIYVTIHVTKATYDRLYLGSKDDENKTPVYIGTAEDGGMAYTFPVSEEDLGKTIPFVPGKSSDDSWYTKAQKYLTLPATLTKEQSGEEPGNTGSTYDDGSYEAEVGSDFAMFPIGSASAEVTDGQIYVTIHVTKATYDRLYLGSKDDENKTPVYTGTAEDGGMAYTFPVSEEDLGKTVSFVPGKSSDDSWYTKAQKYLTLPATLTKEQSGEEPGNTGSTYDDGSYEAEVGSDFAMFPIGFASAEVTDGQIYVTIHVTKATYDRLYLGSKDDENKTPVYIGTAEDGGMAYTFPVSEEDLGKTIPFVPGKSSDDSWYTKAQKYLTLPATLTKIEEPEEPEVPEEPKEAQDGYYTEANEDYTLTVSGGTGKVTITVSDVTVRNGKALATLSFNSEKYPTLRIGEDQYSSAVESGSSVFKKIPLELNADNTVYGTTTAMSQPREIEYTVRIDMKNDAGAAIPTTDTPANGTYSAADDDFASSFSGGSGKVTVTVKSVTVTDGQAKAVIAFDSEKYPTLKVNGQSFSSEVTGGESVFKDVPVPLNVDFEVVGTTTAMSTPRDITYTLHITFYADADPDEGGTEPDPGVDPVEPDTPELGEGDLAVKNNTSMFTIEDVANLKTEGGRTILTITFRTATLTKAYVGTPEEAAKAQNTIARSGNAFAIPLTSEQLSKPFVVSFFSASSNTWASVRQFTINTAAKTLTVDNYTEKPKEEEKPDTNGTTAAVDNSTALADGTYAPETFTWGGGSGRTSIVCERIIVENGKSYAVISFNSNSYTYIKANGQTFYTTQGGGKSTATIPIRLNTPNTILGCTTAMSQPHEIAYTIYAYIPGALAEVDNTTKPEQKIPGLTYLSTDENKEAKLYEVYRYEDGYAVINVINVARYLIVPEGKEVPAPLDEDIQVVQQPVDNGYVGTEEVFDLLTGLKLPELMEKITMAGFDTDAEGVKSMNGPAELQLAQLIRQKCGLVLLPAAFADARVTGADTEAEDAITVDGLTDKDAEAMARVFSGLKGFGIPGFVDRSADEETELGALEWIKLYGILFDCEKAVNAVYTARAAELEAKAA